MIPMPKPCRGVSRHGKRAVPCTRHPVAQGLCARHLAGARRTQSAQARERAAASA